MTFTYDWKAKLQAMRPIVEMIATSCNDGPDLLPDIIQ